MNKSELKELIKFNLLREDSLNNSRLAWFLTFQGFLFAAYSYFLSNNKVTTNDSFTLAIELLGISTSVVTFVMVSLGTYSIYRLHLLWIEIEEDKKLNPFGIQRIETKYIMNAFNLSQLLPVGCLIAWLIIINSTKIILT